MCVSSQVWFNQLMRWIYISPHLDDSVLSAGGLIYDQTRSGEHVEIWTVVCGIPAETESSPLAQVLHFQWGFSTPEETVRKRREEDDFAAGQVGAWVQHFKDFPDCIYRRGGDGQPLYPVDVFAEPHPAELDLPGKMTGAIQNLLQPEDVVVCPLAIGGHVDHRIVRQAVEELSRPLLYYADVPYVFNHPEELAPATRSMQADLYPVSEQGVAEWLKAVAFYKSQLSSLFETPEKMKESIENYAREGIRLYKFSGNPHLKT